MPPKARMVQGKVTEKGFARQREAHFQVYGMSAWTTEGKALVSIRP